MKLLLNDYLVYLREHKHPSPVTLDTYEQALRSINVPEIDSEKLPELYQYLLSVLPERGYVKVELYLAIASAWLKRNGLHLFKEINFYTLYDEIQKLKGKREAYTEHDAISLFSAAYGNNELIKLLILQLYSGLRIGACYPVRYTDFQKVEGHEVFSYPVTSKGVTYYAIIAPQAFATLNRLRLPNQELVVQHDDEFGSPFDKRYRDMLSRAIRSAGLFELRKGKSIFHSMRKLYSQKILSSELNPTDYIYKVLMGHIPKNSTATKFYIVAGKKVPLDLIKRCATAYEKTELMKMTAGLF